MTNPSRRTQETVQSRIHGVPPPSWCWDAAAENNNDGNDGREAHTRGNTWPGSSTDMTGWRPLPPTQLQVRYPMCNSFGQLPRQGSGVGAWQRPAQSGSNSVGLGSWSESSHPSAPEWYHERRMSLTCPRTPALSHTASPSSTPDPHPAVNSLKKSQLPTQEIEKLSRLLTRGS